MLSGEVMTIFNNWSFGVFFFQWKLIPFSYSSCFLQGDFKAADITKRYWKRQWLDVLQVHRKRTPLALKVLGMGDMGLEDGEWYSYWIRSWIPRVHLFWAFVIYPRISNNFTYILPIPQACLVVGFLLPDFSACLLEPFSGGSLPLPLCQNG